MAPGFNQQNPQGPVLFGGSRALQSSPSIQLVLALVLHRGASVQVGCCVGADALVINSAVSLGAAGRLSISSAFAQGGGGSCFLSAVSAVAAAAAAGASVSWLAGGPLSVPLPARLSRRSQAALAGASCAVFFQPGSGSLAVAAHAVAARLPVFAFCSTTPQPIPGYPGAWVAAQFTGLACWQWQAAQIPLF